MSKHYGVQAVPPETAKLAGDCAAEIAVNLGESPEAWRGAAEAARFIKAVVMADVDSLMEVEGELIISEAAITTLLTFAMLERLPMWPPEEEPLMTDGFPDDMRPHFQAPNG